MTEIYPQTARRELIAVAWIAATGPAVLNLYKIWRTTEQIPGYDKPAVQYDMEPVAGDKRELALRWLRQNHYRPEGIWFNAEPGLVWSREPVFNIGGDLPTTTQRAFYALSDDAHYSFFVQDWEIIPAPVAYDWDKTEGSYAYLKTTRSTREMHRLRSRYPHAGELMWLPTLVLARQFDQSTAIPEWATKAHVS